MVGSARAEAGVLARSPRRRSRCTKSARQYHWSPGGYSAVERALHRRVRHRPARRAAAARAARRAAAPSRARRRPRSPRKCQTTPHTLRRWTRSGNGVGRRHGGVREEPVQLARRPREELAVGRQHLGACSTGQNVGPATTVSTGCRRNSNSVTTPKLPPPPRIAQNRSGCSSALARTRSPSASTTSAPSRLSIGQPARARQVPMPPPSVRPPTPVVRDDPARAARARARAWRDRRRPSVQPPPTRRCVWRVDLDVARCGERSMTTPSSSVPSPAPLWPPPRTASAARAHARTRSRARRRPRPCSARSTPDAGRSCRCERGARVVVLGVAGADRRGLEAGQVAGGAGRPSDPWVAHGRRADHCVAAPERRIARI